MAKQNKQTTKTENKRTYTRKNIDDRISQLKGKLLDLELKKKVKDDPEASAIAKQIRQLRKIENPTTSITQAIQDLTKRLI